MIRSWLEAHTATESKQHGLWSSEDAGSRVKCSVRKSQVCIRLGNCDLGQVM